MSTPKSIFGAALLGMSFDDAETVTEVLNILKDCGVTQIDTAPRYPPFKPGKSEDLLGEAQAVSKGFLIDSKVLAKPGGGGELETEALTNSIATTLTRIGSKQVSCFYCCFLGYLSRHFSHHLTACHLFFGLHRSA
jgi:aflatoxin B1 aldehyde reductase